MILRDLSGALTERFKVRNPLVEPNSFATSSLGLPVDGGPASTPQIGQYRAEAARSGVSRRRLRAPRTVRQRQTAGVSRRRLRAPRTVRQRQTASTFSYSP